MSYNFHAPGRGLALFLVILTAGIFRGIPIQAQDAIVLPDQPGAFQPPALPSSRSSHVIFNRFMGLPPFTAREALAGEWFFSPSLELSQIMQNAYKIIDDQLTVVSFFDYEVLSAELPVLVGLGSGWSLGLDLQLAWFSGGILDKPIAAFHDFFDFPNNGRGSVPVDRILMDLDTKNGFSYHLNQATLALADPVLFLGWTAMQRDDFHLQLAVLAAIPLGLGSELTGTTAPQLGSCANLDWWPAAWLGIHGQLGAVLPLESLTPGGPYPSVHARLSIIGNFAFPLLPYINLRFQSSPLQSTLGYYKYNYFTFPNADLHFGVIISSIADRGSGGYGAFTIQEDPISHNSADVSFQASGTFRVGP